MVWAKVKTVVPDQTQFKNIKLLKKGGLVIQSIDDAQKKRVVERLRTVADLSVREGADRDPVLVIGGVM